MQSEKEEVMIAANKNNLRKGKIIIHKKLAIPLGIIVQMTSTLFC